MLEADWARPHFAHLVAEPDVVYASTAAQLERGYLRRGALVMTRCSRGLNVGAVDGFFEVIAAAGPSLFVRLEEYRRSGSDCWDLSSPRQLVAQCD